jgi:hypothetical protein
VLLLPVLVLLLLLLRLHRQPLQSVQRPMMARHAAALLAAAATAATAAAAAAAPPPPGSLGTWSKVLLTDAVAKSGARCLDGSPGGYYMRTHNAKGEAADPKKWVVFMQGGGWCSSDESCAERSAGKLGSSTGWGPTYTDAYEGSQTFAMKPFDSYTIIYGMYCDGGSWTGNAPPKVVGGKTIYYRGRPLLDALLDDLLAKGLAAATDLLWSGCSAGGLTTYVHADYVASRMPSGVKTLALADAMFAVESDSFGGKPLYPARMQWGYAAWNASSSINQKCLKALGGSDGSTGWKCMFGATAAQYVETPLFVVNSKFDTWQQAAIIGVNCTVAKCDAKEQTFWGAYGKKMVALLDSMPPQHGAFVTNCPAHCQTGIASAWGKRTINGTVIGAAFGSWHADRRGGGAGTFKFVEACDGVGPCGSDSCG